MLFTVEDFRSIALQLTQSHYRSSCDRGDVGRIEILPVSWHSELHSEESGIDEKLKAITLESIPKLRTFTNDTLLDILFYSSPVFCQVIYSVSVVRAYSGCDSKSVAISTKALNYLKKLRTVELCAERYLYMMATVLVFEYVSDGNRR